ncbi:MAG: hypothetical protein HY749_08890 [Gammaproteobacteria bacterium]|nr:hypothetical protein [Gammaproteobacteria bacterium]MBI5616811.1 hypothetical protein [Gammaproteobacteria bacterium]
MTRVSEIADSTDHDYDVVVGRNLLVLAVFLLVSFAKVALDLPQPISLGCYAVYVGVQLYALWRIAGGLLWRRLTVALYPIGILVPFCAILVNLALLAAALRGLELLRDGRDPA